MRMIHHFPYVTYLAFTALFAGCSSSAESRTDTTNVTPAARDTETPPSTQNPSPSLSPQEADWQTITRLEEEAKALVDTTGCATTNTCRAAPVGSRGCGGPRYYLVYCSLTTDSAALHRALAKVEAAEQAHNKKYQIASTCEMRMPPNMTSTGAACRAAER